jgi:ABC-2 type transport system ATP-binding protein
MAWTVEAQGLSRRFGTADAVRDLTFSVGEGELFGLLGPNGAGKTTTLKMLTGLLRPTAGSARVAGLDVVRERRRMLAAIGVVFELPALYPRLTVRENLGLAQSLRRAARADLDAAVARLGLVEHLGRPVATLSKGWRQRTMIAKALIGRPRVLFLDEPTSGLDPNAAADLHAVLRELRSEGVTMILTTHDMVEAADLCDRVGIVRAGRLVAMDTPAALVERLQGRSVRLRWWDDGALREANLPLADSSTPSRLSEVLSRHRVLDVETTGSLDDVYRRLTGGKEG